MCTIVILHETHAPIIKRKLCGKEEGDGEKQKLGSALGQALTRPVKLLVKSPVVLAGCVLIFLVIGLLNIFLTELSRTVQQIYQVSPGQSGMMYFGLALGFSVASIVFGSTNDKIVHALARRHSGELLPEYRLPATIAAMPLVIIGTLWYGWNLEYRAHWSLPIAGSGIAGLGITTVQVSLTSAERFSARRAKWLQNSISLTIMPSALRHHVHDRLVRRVFGLCASRHYHGSVHWRRNSAAHWASSVCTAGSGLGQQRTCTHRPFVQRDPGSDVSIWETVEDEVLTCRPSDVDLFPGKDVMYLGAAQRPR